METIAEIKERAVAQTPLLLFDVELADGSTERWSTHRVALDGREYAARVIGHNFFEIQSASESGIDAVPRISLTLANADSVFSQIESARGFKGAKIDASFLFWDLSGDESASEASVVFRGILNPPEEITESSMRVSAVNRMNMQRVLLPPVRIQRRCPWPFPSSLEDRAEAVNGGSESRYSRFFRCGYSAGEVGGSGNLEGEQPFTSCAFTRSDCVARGMFDRDASGAVTRRFGGIEFIPSTIRVRGHGERGFRDSDVALNEARYNDFVPLMYGTGWLEPPVVFARNDGNLTRMEVLLASGKVTRIVKVLVGDIEIPAGVDGRDMTASGWWNLFADGDRTGGFNLNFTAPDGSPLGDPYGSLASISIVVPNQINDGKSLPKVKILLEGTEVERFDGGGQSLGFGFSDNPAWVLLDVLRRSGWLRNEVDLLSFYQAAAFCDEEIAGFDNEGNGIPVRRFQCNVTLRSRRTAADVIRGIRNNARLQLTYRTDGKLTVFVENSILLQQPVKAYGSNAAAELNGGWPAYEYGDGSTADGRSGILRASDGRSSLRLWSRPITDTPNRFSIEFADRFNEFQQDSLAVSDDGDVARTGQEITGRFIVDGLPTFDQAARVLKFVLDKTVKGNRFAQFETSVKALGQRVGDIITITYAKEGLQNQPFRIQKIEPGLNYRIVRITAQVHDDAWYNDTNGQITSPAGARRLPGSQAGLPLALMGAEVDDDGRPRFGIEEFQSSATDGSILVEIEVSFQPPAAGRSTAAGVPIVGLQPEITFGSGSIAAAQTLYYAVTASDAEGEEGTPSFIIPAAIPAGPDTAQVKLNRLSFSGGAATFSVYRGDVPSRLSRIAENQPLSDTFVDPGLPADPRGAPDPNFSHANFYWRLEESDEFFADIFTPESIGNSSLALGENTFTGRAVRLIRGKGDGQERVIVGNTSTTLFVSPPWQPTPDESTIFVVSDNTWRFAGRARTSPARFQIPNLRGRVAQITGRGANAQNIESLEGLALITRWRIGGGGLGVADRGLAPEPIFGLNVVGDGTVTVGGIGFPTLENTQSITTGLLSLHYRDELTSEAPMRLMGAIDEQAAELRLDPSIAAEAGELIQLGSEILEVESDEGGGLFRVRRGLFDSVVVPHDDQTEAHLLRRRTETISFRRAFFGTEESGVWRHIVRMPSVRVVCAELRMSNAFGEGAPGAVGFSGLAGGGLRTLRGGQFSLQIEGSLGIMDDAAPRVVVQEPLAVRDVFADLKSAPVGGDVAVEVRQDGDLIATPRVLEGERSSFPISGDSLPALREGAKLTLNVLEVGGEVPGADLTVTIRF